MESVAIFSVSDLLQRSRPLTAAASLQPSSSISRKNPKPTPISYDVSPENPSKTLRPLKTPAIIVGTVHLPAAAAAACAPTIEGTCASKHSCLSFSDGLSAICCAVLDKDFSAVGKKIRVLAWNFIPFKSGVSGLLEIIRWGFLEPTSEIGGGLPLVSSPSFSLFSRQSNHSCVLGRLDSVGTIFSVPCIVQTRNLDAKLVPGSSGSKNMVGFLTEISVCECPVCSNGGCTDVERKMHSFTTRVVVYFIGSAVGWHPLLCKLLGHAVSVVGVIKKLIFEGEDESYLAFVTTEKAAVFLSKLHSEAMPAERKVISGKGELGSYTGIVTGIFFQGMTVELDGKVWLLLSEGVVAPHSLRVGALISLSNVHFVWPKFSWIKMLLLGTCYKSSINVKSFSPFETQCNSRSRAQCLLLKFIESLNFSARFWVLLTISCFRKKFSGIFSEKEILGTTHNKGLAQKYATLCLPSCAFQPEYRAFIEFCKHDFASCSKEPDLGPLKLAVPISNFISKCEALWATLQSEIQNDVKSVGVSGHVSHLSCQGRSYQRMLRQVISSEDLGIVLVGTLKVCLNSGRLQLADATGRIDVMVPDLISNADVGNVYEVTDYRVFLEGLPSWSGPCKISEDASFSCQGIFSKVSCRSKLNQLTIFVQFYLSNTTFLNAPLCLPLCKSHIDDFKANPGGAFHVLLVTHKFPFAYNLLNDPEISNRSSSFAEAIIFPYYLLLSGDNGDAEWTGDSRDQLRSHLECADRKNFPQQIQFKRQKTAHGSNGEFPHSSMEIVGAAQDQTDCSGSTLEISCSVAVRSINDKFFIPGTLFCLNKKCHAVDSLSREKVLLEFKSESLSEYQLLQIGVYYVVKYSKDVIHDKTIVITSQTCLWSLSFTSGGIKQKNESVQDLEISPVSGDGLTFRKSSVVSDEVLSEKSPQGKLDGLSDLQLHLSIESNHLKEARKALEDGLIRSIATLQEAVGVSTCSQIMMEALKHPSGAPDHVCQVPEGYLISVRGDIADVHSLHHNSVFCKTHSNLGIIGGNILKRAKNNICIHVREDSHLVTIRGTICSSAYPVGLGTGAHATFHRVLLTISSFGQCELTLTPVSIIVVHTVKKVIQHYNDGFFQRPPKSDVLNGDHADIVSSNLISHLSHYSEGSKQIRLRCRVVAVLTLVLEKDPKKSIGLRSKDESPGVSIPLAGFVLDDGSSSCCCWANGDRAVMLFRLHENNANNKMYKKMQSNRSRNSMSDLEKMLIKHHRIVVKNCGTQLDSSLPDLIFSPGSNQITCSDERVLRSIIMKSCQGSVLSVIGSLMPPNAMGDLEMEILEMHQHFLKSMQNFWAREVGFVDPLAEARSTLQLLIK